MVYVDTNVLIYISVNQDKKKQEESINLVRELIKSGELFLSPLTIQEFIFTMAKLRVDPVQIERDIDFYMDYVQQTIDRDIIKEAYNLCKDKNSCKNINDAIHLVIAGQYCSKLITYDEDFNKFKIPAGTGIEIEILK